jgi:histidyl-tRNA synthetase
MTEPTRLTEPATTPRRAAESPVGLVRGTKDWLPPDFARIAALERRLIDHFIQSGYQPVKTPILEFTELHERKSGAGIVSRLFELESAGGPQSVCLRPELTASIVRAYTEAPVAPALPWRVCMSGSVFRHEESPGGDRLTLREFTQVGVELLGAPGPDADAEIIALADRALQHLGVTPSATIRIGHVGLILELLRQTGLPPAAAAALTEMLSAAAAEGGRIQALESALERLVRWLNAGSDADSIVPAVSHADDHGVDRLFRQLVPHVTGRRSGHEIIGRLRHKWNLDHSLSASLTRVRERVHLLAELRGPIKDVLRSLDRELAAAAPAQVEEVAQLASRLQAMGVDLTRVELDLGFGRGIGFYTQMIFELIVTTPEGPVEVGGGGRYDGLAQVLGSDRDDRGTGFAFGLERLDDVTKPKNAS